MAFILEVSAGDTTSLCYKVRFAMGLSQVDFARRIGVSPVTVAFWETRRRNPSGLYLERLNQFAVMYGVK